MLRRLNKIVLNIVYEELIYGRKNSSGRRITLFPALSQHCVITSVISLLSDKLTVI